MLPVNTVRLNLMLSVQVNAAEEENKPRRKHKKGTEIPSSSGEPIADEDANVPSVSTPSNDPLLSGEDRLKLTELMDLCTQSQSRVLTLESTKSTQALEIESLKQGVKKLEKKRRSRTYKPKRLYKVGSSRRVESSEGSLGAKKDASKQGRKIADIDADTEVTLVDETRGMNDDNPMFDTGVLDEQEVIIEKEVNEKEVSAADPVTTAGEVVTTASVDILD
ncbi:hypothetical protein Tco_0525309 [Tanacetum coccineum]